MEKKHTPNVNIIIPQLCGLYMVFHSKAIFSPAQIYTKMNARYVNIWNSMGKFSTKHKMNGTSASSKRQKIVYYGVPKYEY